MRSNSLILPALLFAASTWLYTPLVVSDEMPAEMLEAMELEADIERGAKAYALCATCHEAHGWGKPDGSFPAIAGQHRSVLIKQLADIRSRKRNNPTMFPFSDPETIGGPQAIADVTAYIAGLPVNPETGMGPGTNLAEGENLFNQQCALCHADDASGSDDFVFPRLRNQHFVYLKRQMTWIKDGYRRNANAEMKRRLEAMSEAQIESVADYISRIAQEKVTD